MEGKKKNKDEVYITSDGVLNINNQEYLGSITKKKMIDGIEHTGDTLFRKFDRKDFEMKVDVIVDRIKHTLTKEELINELMKKQMPNEIDKLYDILKSTEKKKPEITKQDGCIGIKIGSGKPKTGGRYIQLIE